MKEQDRNYSAPFQGIRDTSRITGFSQSFLRAGCRNGSIPCIRIGSAGVYRINVPALLERLDTDSRRAVAERMTQ